LENLSAKKKKGVDREGRAFFKRGTRILRAISRAGRPCHS